MAAAQTSELPDSTNAWLRRTLSHRGSRFPRHLRLIRGLPPRKLALMPFASTNYDTETLALAHRVLDAAWLKKDPEGLVPPKEALTLRALMAKRIIAAVREGEVDPERLKAFALKGGLGPASGQ